MITPSMNGAPLPGPPLVLEENLAPPPPPPPPSAGPTAFADEPPAATYSATAPPVYPANEVPETPSSRVTECDVMSDYQAQLKEEDFHHFDDVPHPLATPTIHEDGSPMPRRRSRSSVRRWNRRCRFRRHGRHQVR